MNKNIKNTLNIHFDLTTQSTESLRQTAEMQIEREAYSHFSQFIYKEASENNIKNILEIEESILKNDLSKATDKREISTVQAGLDRIRLATESLDNVTSYRSFEKCTKTTAYKDIDSRGLPKDAFRKEIPSQITSLQNNTRDNKPQHLKDFLDARTYALKTAEALYKAVQHKHMIKFCQEHPDHPHTENYLSKPANQKLFNKEQNQEQVKQRNSLER